MNAFFDLLGNVILVIIAMIAALCAGYAAVRFFQPFIDLWSF